MPYKKPNIEKFHYSIGEVAKMFNVKPSLLRYWEKEFHLYIKPFKNKKGNRYYTQKDIENIALIFHLTKEKGLTLEGAKQQLKLKKDEEINNFSAIIYKLNNIKQELLQIKEHIKKLSNEQET